MAEEAAAKKRGGRRPGTTRTMDAKEREARMAEMRIAATVHKSTMAAVQQAADAERHAEDAEQVALQGKAPSFIGSIKEEALAGTSMQEQVRSKAFYSQRKGDSFMRR